MTKTNNELYAAIGKTFATLSDLYTQLGDGTEASAPAAKPSRNTKAEKATKAVEVEETSVDVEEDGEEGTYTKEDLNEMQLSELKELADENGIEYTKSVKKQPLIKIILDAMEEDEEEAEEEEEDATAVEESDEDVEEEDEEEEEESSTVIETEDGEVDLATMSFGKLKKLAADYEIELTAKNKAGAIEEILAAMDADEEEEEEADEEEGEEALDLDAMDLDELKALAEEYDIELPKKKKAQKAADYTQAIRDLLEESLDLEGEEDEEEEEEAADEEEDDEEEETDIAEEYGLNDMSLEELAEFLEDYGLSTKGKKQALIARIVKGIEDGTIEVDEEEGE